MARILIIEDDGDLQQLLSLALFREGYEVHYSFNGQEGYDKVLSLHPDLVLLDLMLPVLNGMEVLRLLSTNASVRDIPVIVMTGHGDRTDMLEKTIKISGAREYIRKPFSLKEMVATIGRLLVQYPLKPVEASEAAKGVVRLDFKFRTVSVKGHNVATLSPMKAKLLRILLEAKGAVAKDRLVHALWGAQGKPAALEKLVQRLREDFGSEARRIQTTGEGYEFVG